MLEYCQYPAFTNLPTALLETTIANVRRERDAQETSNNLGLAVTSVIMKEMFFPTYSTGQTSTLSLRVLDTYHHPAELLWLCNWMRDVQPNGMIADHSKTDPKLVAGPFDSAADAAESMIRNIKRIYTGEPTWNFVRCISEDNSNAPQLQLITNAGFFLPVTLTERKFVKEFVERNLYEIAILKKAPESFKRALINGNLRTTTVSVSDQTVHISYGENVSFILPLYDVTALMLTRQNSNYVDVVSQLRRASEIRHTPYLGLYANYNYGY